MIIGKVKGQMLSVTYAPIVSGTENYISAEFDISDDWNGCDEIWAHFQCGAGRYEIMLNAERKITQDMHLNLTDGRWTVFLHGSKYDDADLVQRITTHEEEITVMRTGYPGGDPFPEIAPSALEQAEARINEKIGDLNDLVTEEKDSLVGAINEAAQATGSSDHTQLTNRDAADQHPISAITGLQTALDGKGTYSKPSGGIPKTDFASAVQTSLEKADNAQPKAITDAGGYYETDTVESALQEIGAKLAQYPTEVWEGGNF